MDLTRIAIRALFAYIFLLALIRNSGKRTIAQGTIMDFVVALVLGDMIDDLLWAEVPASQFVVGAGTVCLTHLLVSLASSRSERLAVWIEGASLMFMRAGSLLRPAMRKEHITEKEAEEMLRLQGLERERWDEVKSAWVEVNGRPAVLKLNWAKTAQKQDLPALKKLQK